MTFGRYEQDGNEENGPEEIEWIVLDVQDEKVLLLSKYGLEVKPYNTEITEITWEACSMRAWLNGNFLNEAFSTGEQSSIPITEVDNSDAQGYSGWSRHGEKNTQDKIFLLSYAEANRYLGVKLYNDDDDGINIKSRVAPTEYAIENGAWTIEEYKTADGQLTGGVVAAFPRPLSGLRRERLRRRPSQPHLRLRRQHLRPPRFLAGSGSGIF